MKRIIATGILILSGMLLQAQSLDEIIAHCNQQAKQTNSAYYEALIEIKTQQSKHKYLHKVSFKKTKTKQHLPKFSIMQLHNNLPDYRQFYDQRNFTLIDYASNVAKQYRKEDIDVFEQEIEVHALHPYMMKSKLFDKKKKYEQITLLQDTVINGEICGRIEIRKQEKNKTIWLDRHEIYTISLSSYQPMAVKSEIRTCKQGTKDTVQKSYEVNFLRLDLNAAFSDNHFDYRSDKSPYTLQYMSYSALKEQWKMQEKDQSSFAYGNKAVPFRLPNSNNEIVNLEDMKGKVVILAFYYNNCSPCIQMLSDLEALYQSYKDKGLEVVALNPIDNGSDSEQFNNFVKRNHLNYHLCSVPRKTLEEIYLVYSYPTIFIVDKKGKICFSHQGYNALFSLEVEKAIKKEL